MAEPITVGGRTGEIDRVESDGTTHVWFGDVRADGAHIVEAFTQVEILGTVDAVLLHQLKANKILEIDATTSALIDRGFEYPADSGQLFSLSLVAQSNLTNAIMNRDSLAYPIQWATKDSMTVITLKDASMVVQFYSTALLFVRGHRDSGTALKVQVIAASTPEEIDAIKDDR